MNKMFLYQVFCCLLFFMFSIINGKVEAPIIINADGSEEKVKAPIIINADGSEYEEPKFSIPEKNKEKNKALNFNDFSYKNIWQMNDEEYDFLQKNEEYLKSNIFQCINGSNKPKNIYDSWTFYEWIKFRNEIRGVSRLKVYPTPYVDQLKDTRKFLSKNCMKLVSILEDSQKNKPNQDMCSGIKQLLVLVDEKHKNLIQQKEKENNSSFDEDIMYLEKTKSDLNQHLSWLRLSLFECWE